jgi:hypothetical protein
VRAMTIPTELSRYRVELALAFCRECLAWPDASCGESRSIVENRRRPELSHAYGKMCGFQLDPTDSGNVMNAVKEWCDINAVGFSLKYSPGASSKYSWRTRTSAHAETQSGDLCTALMLACLHAHRNIGERGARMAIEAMPGRHNPAILANPWGNIRENAQIALAFCRECLGWTNARMINDFGYVYMSEDVPEHLADSPMPPWQRSFHFNENHVDRVIDAVKGWCDAHAVGFVLEYFPSGSAKDCWLASVGFGNEASGDGASAALMSACIVACRKIGLADNAGALIEL